MKGVPELGIEDIPLTAQLDAKMIVTVVVEVDRDTFRNNRRIITSEAVYEYSGGAIVGSPSPDGSEGMAFLEDTQGSWVLVSYEIVG